MIHTIWDRITFPLPNKAFSILKNNLYYYTSINLYLTKLIQNVFIKIISLIMYCILYFLFSLIKLREVFIFIYSIAFYFRSRDEMSINGDS